MKKLFIVIGLIITLLVGYWLGSYKGKPILEGTTSTGNEYQVYK